MIAIAPSHKNQLTNYTSWLTKRNLPFVVLKDGDSLASCSMLLLCGGPDVGSVPERDEREIRWFNESYGKIPVLGICRGLQISNVILGGSLHEDLSSERVMHTSSVNEISGEPAKTLESSWHDVVINGKKIRVNSRHHQGISVLAPGLKPIALCEEDDLVEMAEGDKALFVQWHPEREEVWGTEAEQVVYDWIMAHHHNKDTVINKIRSYADTKGFTVISYDRIRKSIDSTLDDSSIDLLIESNRHLAKRVKDKHGRKAIKVLS